MRGTQRCHVDRRSVSRCLPRVDGGLGVDTIQYGVQTYTRILFHPSMYPSSSPSSVPLPAAARRHCAKGSTRAMFLSLSMRASAFTTSSLTMASSSKYSKGATRQRACVTPRARLDAGVGAFGSKAGMTQVFTEDGLCVPVTVIAVREGNVVTQVRIRGNFFFVCGRAWSRSRRCRSTRRWIHSFGVGDATRRRWARRRP